MTEREGRVRFGRAVAVLAESNAWGFEADVAHTEMGNTATDYPLRQLPRTYHTPFSLPAHGHGATGEDEEAVPARTPVPAPDVRAALGRGREGFDRVHLV